VSEVARELCDHGLTRTAAAWSELVRTVELLAENARLRAERDRRIAELEAQVERLKGALRVRPLSDARGAVAVEYGVIAAVIAVALAVPALNLGTNIAAVFNTVAAQL